MQATKILIPFKTKLTDNIGVFRPLPSIYESVFLEIVND